MKNAYIITFDVSDFDKEIADNFSGKKFNSYHELQDALPKGALTWILPYFVVSANNEEISLTDIWLAVAYVI